MILLIDSYDSFTNNLAHLLKVNANQEVITIHNDSFEPDAYEDFFSSCLGLFEYVVIGPGPGHPSIESDVGIISWLFKKYRENYNKDPNTLAVPILGICLGFQSLCYEFGNEVTKLKEVKHGQAYDIYPIDGDTILGVGPFKSVRYHSLYVDSLNDQILPLAHCYEGESKNKILMAVKHRELPFYGVQYHPESICSSSGDNLIKNFTKFSNSYNNAFRPEVFNDHAHTFPEELVIGHAVHENCLIDKFNSTRKPTIYLKKFQLESSVTQVDVCDSFYNKDSSDFILLNSASVPGEWSIIGLPIAGETEIITHSMDEKSTVRISKYKSEQYSKVALKDDESAWKVVAERMKEKYISHDNISASLGNYHSRRLPFFGGYLGLISYEEGQHIVIDKLDSICAGPTPDLKLAFVERFIVFDHKTNDWFVGSIKENDSAWIESIHEELKTIQPLDQKLIPFTVADLCLSDDKSKIRFDFPSQDIYREQFKMCQEYLHSGDSYELCLTTQSKINLPSYIKSWDIYKVLTLRKNPSPFSCYMEFEDCVLISSSPERFLSWKEDESGSKRIELRPIKGTVKNTPDVDLATATKILKTPKEMGENLMIVDLIRHDLFQFADEVEVTQLMAVEEYKTVFQLVSVIQGKSLKAGYHGIDVLHTSLPPGSMTGAPKKRSVELLRSIEGLQKSARRGIYSGVVGYWSVTDESDWSVIIRSVFRYKDDKSASEDTNIWRIGAGGAITVLSDPQDEWDELKLKLSSALQAFQ